MKLKHHVASLLRRWANKLSGGPLAPDNTVGVWLTTTTRKPQRLMVEQKVVIPRNPQEFTSDYLTEYVPKDLARKIGEGLLQNGLIAIEKQYEPEHNWITFCAKVEALEPITY